MTIADDIPVVDNDPYERYIVNEHLIYGALKTMCPGIKFTDDILQNARLGLWRACLAFNKERGAFSTFAYYHIMGEVKNAYKKADPQVESLDALLGESGSSASFADILEGESDVGFTDYRTWYTTLSDVDKEIVGRLIAGYRQADIGRTMGQSKAVISAHVKKIQKSFNKYI